MIHHSLSCAAILGAFLVVDATGQSKLDARAFVPSDPQLEFVIDLEAMRECELWGLA